LASPVHTKLELAVYGLRLSADLAEDPALERVSTARDFASRDVEIVLPNDIVAQCPVDSEAAKRSPFELFSRNDSFWLRDDRNGEDDEIQVSLIPPPGFYGLRTSNDTPMWEIGTVHAGYLSIDPAASCEFADQGLARQFCPLQGAPPVPDKKPCPVEDVLEVVRAAFEEGAAEFVYFHTGFFESEDGGFAFLEPYVQAVKKHFDTIVAVQSHPPRDKHWIDRAYAAGVDAMSYAVEIHDPDLLAEYCRGRSRVIGRERYYEALAYAARIFPSGTVWSDLIVGLEPLESTCAGIDELTRMGVLPVLSIFRPLDETDLANHPVPDPVSVAPVYAHLYKAVRESAINVQLMRDLGYAITPIEARFFAGEDAKLDVAVSSFYRSKIGSRAVRGLSKLRRRLRVRRVSESFDSSRL
jgi:hypothetical protein